MYCWLPRAPKNLGLPWIASSEWEEVPGYIFQKQNCKLGLGWVVVRRVNLPTQEQFPQVTCSTLDDHIVVTIFTPLLTKPQTSVESGFPSPYGVSSSYFSYKHNFLFYRFFGFLFQLLDDFYNFSLIFFLEALLELLLSTTFSTLVQNILWCIIMNFSCTLSNIRQPILEHFLILH